MSDPPYNPLAKFNLAKSIEGELLNGAVRPLTTMESLQGAGVYAIYYCGIYPSYKKIAAENINGRYAQPIYIGKAIPKGGRKGGLMGDVSRSRALADRLRQHATSIEEASNLNVRDFFVRHLVVDDIWIPLGENILIETFKPIWNRALDGFGNKDPGRRRAKQFKSPWDVVHPGRKFAEKLADGGMTPEFLNQRIADYLAGRPLARLPKAVANQQAKEQEEAEEAADEA